MFIKKLKLQDFRNYHDRQFIFTNDLSLLVGPNAIGKTNVLEAIYLLGTGKSLRVGLEQEMIRNQQSLARISGLIVDGEDNKVNLEIVLTRGLMGWHAGWELLLSILRPFYSAPKIWRLYWDHPASEESI